VSGIDTEPRHWIRDIRVWIGIAISVACLAYVIQGVPLASVGDAIEHANLLLLAAVSVPAHCISIYIRSLRWRHLTNPVAKIDRGPLFRSTAIGFMVNNLAPLRIGELVRSWLLSRETGASGSAILGTVVLERVLDVACVLVLAAFSLSWLGVESSATGVLREGAYLMAPVAVAPILLLIVVRVAPARVAGLVGFSLKPFPEGVQDRGREIVTRFAEGLGAISRGSHLFWIVLHSLLIWLVFATLPILAGVWSFDIELGGPARTLVTSWIMLAALGVAVAIPSAPGFVGPYQLAFQAVLSRFGVPPATALAMGLLVWLAFWIPVTLQGVIVMRFSRMSLSELLSRGR